ncbi:uncharacterized protein LOC128878758 [Hylaeus volcanicus]|uniref:uncharacterized protein LOC128878758 n=1 Tax=Hylaeus volcanicus TaxID=313075 RepID=UPI0023B86236|nr:uncharacterized protein LOC128878758 [Hylaeus volcanicus]
MPIALPLNSPCFSYSIVFCSRFSSLHPSLWLACPSMPPPFPVCTRIHCARPLHPTPSRPISTTLTSYSPSPPSTRPLVPSPANRIRVYLSSSSAASKLFFLSPPPRSFLLPSKPFPQDWLLILFHLSSRAKMQSYLSYSHGTFAFPFACFLVSRERMRSADPVYPDDSYRSLRRRRNRACVAVYSSSKRFPFFARNDQTTEHALESRNLETIFASIVARSDTFGLQPKHTDREGYGECPAFHDRLTAYDSQPFIPVDLDRYKHDPIRSNFVENWMKSSVWSPCIENINPTNRFCSTVKHSDDRGAIDIIVPLRKFDKSEEAKL